MSPYSACARPGETVSRDGLYSLWDNESGRRRYGSGPSWVRLQIAPGRRGDAGVTWVGRHSLTRPSSPTRRGVSDGASPIGWHHAPACSTTTRQASTCGDRPRPTQVKESQARVATARQW